MKDLEHIEKTLREAKPPDHDMTRSRHKVWQNILKRRRERRKRFPLAFIKPWMWALASVIVIVICLFYMLVLCRG